MTKEERREAIAHAKRKLIQELDLAYKFKRYEDDNSDVITAQWRLDLLVQAQRLEHDLEAE